MAIKILKQYKPFITENWRYKCVYGGRGKGATWQYAMLLLLKSMEERLRILCTREFQNSIDKSVYHTLVTQIDRLELPGFKVRQNFIHSPGGGKFIFEGLRYNIDSIKSMEGIDITWVAEADKVPQDAWDKLIPTVFRHKYSEIWIDFNTDQEDDPVYNMLVKNKRKNALVLFQTYQDNPEFPEGLREEMEYCKEHDYEKYLWIWMGQPRTFSELCIMHGKWREDEFETPEDAQFFHGVDWGFAHDPIAALRCYIKDDILFIDRECGGVGIEITKTADLFDSIDTLSTWPSRADNARPELINHMQTHGYRKMEAAKKGKGSVLDGIAKIRGFKEVIVHSRCVNVQEEFKLYKYKKNALTNEITPVPEDKNNHWIDALRYALEPYGHRHRAQIHDKKTIGL